jgi:DNA/RNA endonuclease G (NUC1)
MPSFVRRFQLALVALFLIVLPISAQPNRNIRFGKPTPHTPFADPKKEDFSIERDEYVLSFNGNKNIPNWVAWNLLNKDVGDEERGAFEPDPILPKGFDKVTTKTYAGAGFDRGHMCPSKDRSASREANDNLFFMTNIIPQSPNNNQKGWEHLEAYCRDLAEAGNSLYIVCGPTGQGGEGKLGHKNFIGDGKIKVLVPALTWFSRPAKKRPTRTPARSPSSCRTIRRSAPIGPSSVPRLATLRIRSASRCFRTWNPKSRTSSWTGSIPPESSPRKPAARTSNDARPS